MTSAIEMEAYNEASDAIRDEINAMLCLSWPETFPGKPAHLYEFSVRSFYARMDGRLAAYSAVVQKEIRHNEVPFRFAGISSVAVLPEYRKHGLGSQIVRAATDWMVQQPGIDFGIFTCHFSLTGFYQRAGAWRLKPELTLVGNGNPEALNSRTLKVAVLQRLFSRHARQHEAILTHGIINLNFPDGEFL